MIELRLYSQVEFNRILIQSLGLSRPGILQIKRTLPSFSLRLVARDVLAYRVKKKGSRGKRLEGQKQFGFSPCHFHAVLILSPFPLVAVLSGRFRAFHAPASTRFSAPGVFLFKNSLEENDFARSLPISTLVESSRPFILGLKLHCNCEFAATRREIKRGDFHTSLT